MAKTVNQKDMKNINLIEVLRIIRKHKSLTRKEIQKLSGLSWGGISQIITGLTEKKLIVNAKDTDVLAAGRRPEVISLNDEDNFVIGIDINISGLYGVIVNLNSHIIFKAAEPADFSNKNRFIADLVKFIRKIIKSCPNKTFMGIGISMQGKIDEENGISKEFVGITNKDDIPMGDILSTEFNLPVHIAHDPECLLTAYGCNGGDNRNKDSILLRIDYGIGMAVKKNGKLISAPGMLEISKTQIFDNTGNIIGRLGDYSTLFGIEKRYPGIFENLSEANTSAAKAFDEMALHLGKALANTMIIFDIDNLVLCGKMTEYKDFYFDKMYQILKSSLNDSISIDFFDVTKAAVGAAEIALDKKILKI